MGTPKKKYFDQALQKKFEDILNKKDLVNKTRNRPAVLDGYALFHQRFKKQKRYEFVIYGKRGKYKPVFAVEDGYIYNSCDCSNGRKELSCQHRNQVLLGDEKLFTNLEHIENYKLLVTAFKDSKQQEHLAAVKYQLLPAKESGFKVAFDNLFLTLNLFFLGLHH